LLKDVPFFFPSSSFLFFFLFLEKATGPAIKIFYGSASEALS